MRAIAFREKNVYYHTKCIGQIRVKFLKDMIAVYTVF